MAEESLGSSRYLGGSTALVVLAGLLAGALTLADRSGRLPGAPGREANVVVVVIDALRFDRLGANGYPLPTTPNIDVLASSGLSLLGISHSTLTEPSIATLFSGVGPSRHGIIEAGKERGGGFEVEVLPQRWQTLPEHLHAGGWATAGFVNQVYLNPRFGFGRGFETYRWTRSKTAFQLNHAFADWLPSVAGRRFFTYLHYLDVHWPYDRTLQAEPDQFGPTELAEAPPARGRQVGEWAQRWLEKRELAGMVRALAARYDEEVAYADAAVGDLVGILRRADRFEDTIVVVTADHGEAFWEHGRLLHGHAPYEELIRVPLVVRLPAAVLLTLPDTAMGGAANTPPVGLVDLLPTLLDWTGLPPARDADGIPLRRLLAGGGRSRLLFAETADAIAVRGERYKLIRFSGLREELFDLTVDPGERSPLPCDSGAGEAGASCRMLSRALDAYLAASSRLRTSTAGTVPAEADDIEQLKVLGYL